MVETFIDNLKYLHGSRHWRRYVSAYKITRQGSTHCIADDISNPSSDPCRNPSITSRANGRRSRRVRSTGTGRPCCSTMYIVRPSRVRPWLHCREDSSICGHLTWSRSSFDFTVIGTRMYMMEDCVNDGVAMSYPRSPWWKGAME